ncbi:MAG TPA: glycoside hydrolase family 127 protein [Steroidobacteraceae bacterium]|nr:glycoside hydrolase family 127 protein [Steroidobacteraceae bacterium]
MTPPSLDRRQLLLGGVALALAGRSAPLAATMAERRSPQAQPLPLAAVRLRASDFAEALEANRMALRRLDPDRLLHTFRVYAGLPPKAPGYGGWEADTIAGHTLGHYLSALSLCGQQTGDPELRRRATYIVGELAFVQARRGSGYVGALGRKRADGRVVDGEEIFGEISRGQIRASGFDLNGSWSPLYTVHKLFAGLLDVHGAFGDRRALAVATGLAGYFERVFAPLTPAQVQEVLACEYGGLNESYAELYARTGERRWLRMAELLRDERVIGPLERREDRLAGLHANTQVPKLVGLARLHELTGSEPAGTAARCFWDAVTTHHSYVIGGNSDRESFSAPDTLADHVTEQTCEHCNTYNMLKLTRKLWSWAPDGALFDYYERAHLNHVLAAIDPRHGRYAYMMPLMSGTAREYSSAADEDFWCCVGTGMESHAKHGDSIFWEGRDGTLYVNLYIPAEADWASHGVRIGLDTAYPHDGKVRLEFAQVHNGNFRLALRIPAWAGGAASLAVNGQPVDARRERGYALVERAWHAGDVVVLELPLELRTEATPGDARLVAVLRGPLVLAADLGAAEDPWQGPEPALVGAAPLSGFTADDAAASRYATRGTVRPADLGFVPFYRQYQRRSAVYLRRYTDAEWASAAAAWQAEQARQRDLAARAVDIMALGETQPEREHQLASELSWPLVYRGRRGRDVRSGGHVEFSMRCRPGPLVLQATYWGGESARDFDLFVDGRKIATQHLDNDRPGQFIDVDYALDPALTAGRASIRVRIVPHERNTAGPVFGLRLLPADAGAVPGA